MLAISAHLSPIAINAIQSLEPDCTLKLGDSSREVQRLQLILKEFDLYAASLDGHFGVHTEQSLSKLQDGLDVEATGEFDLSTWYQLTYWSEEFAQPLRVATATPVLA